MLLAIDVGNTQTAYGLWDGSRWLHVWRRSTAADETEDQLAGWLNVMFAMGNLPFGADAMICASVVPQLHRSLSDLARERFNLELIQLDADPRFGLKVDFSPAATIGADRLANCIGALARWEPPIVVVDFGTATTFDVVDATGAYVGGAILPGIEVSTEALVSRAAKLPRFELKLPDRAIGRSTVEALQSGVVIGYAGAIDAIGRKIFAELGSKPNVVATGGLGEMFQDLCEIIESYDGLLTLDGLRHAHAASTSSP